VGPNSGDLGTLYRDSSKKTNHSNSPPFFVSTSKELKLCSRIGLFAYFMISRVIQIGREHFEQVPPKSTLGQSYGDSQISGCQNSKTQQTMHSAASTLLWLSIQTFFRIFHRCTSASHFPRPAFSAPPLRSWLQGGLDPLTISVRYS